MFREVLARRPLRNGRSGAAAPAQRERRRYIVSISLILVGGLLAGGAPAIIQLGDSYIARTRLYEADEWVRQHDVAPAQPDTAAPERDTVVVPGEEGYLLIIPKIGLRAIVRELETDVFSGRNTPALKRYGLGQVPDTDYLRNVSPGAEGTAAIVGHRTTSGAPFRHIDRLEPGDSVIIRKLGVEQQWVVISAVIVPPSNVEVIRSRPGEKRLMILACSPPFSARERLVVTAWLRQQTVESGVPRTPAGD